MGFSYTDLISCYIFYEFIKQYLNVVLFYVKQIFNCFIHYWVFILCHDPTEEVTTKKTTSKGDESIVTIAAKWRVKDVCTGVVKYVEGI